MKIKDSIQFLIISMLLALSVSCTGDTVAGGQTTNQASVGITVFRADGVTPAAGATVKLFTAGDTSKTPLDERTLDENGQIDPKDLVLNDNTPYHNLLIELDSKEALYHDSLFITEENYTNLKNDTLAPVGSISGTVAIQVNHTPIAVLVHALGTDIYTTVDGVTGEFSLDGLGAGNYNLMFTCDYDEYAVHLFDTLAVSGETTTIPDIIEIPYLGIPVVKGISSTYDTLNATATISWNKTVYTQFSTYEVYRTTDLTSWPETPLAVVSDTVYRDIHTSFGTDSVYYRVGVRNLSGVSGLQFGKSGILPVSPSLATTTFSSSLFHLKKQKEVTACSINDSLKVNFSFSNPSRKFTSVDVGNGLIAKIFDEPVSSYSDSLFMFITVDTIVPVTMIDDHGKEWSESISIQVVEDKPVIISIDSTVSLNVLDTIRAVVSDEYGEIVKYEWDLDGDGVFEVETIVPEVEVMVDSIGILQVGLNVTDDDGNIANVFLCVTIQLIWEKVAEGGIDKGYVESVFLFNGNVYCAWPWGGIYVLNENNEWSHVADLPDYVGEVVVFKNMLYLLSYNVIGGVDDRGYVRLYTSSDCVSWELKHDVPYNGVTHDFPKLFQFRNELYFNYYDETRGNYLYKSSDGKVWSDLNQYLSDGGVASPSMVIHSDGFYVMGIDYSKRIIVKRYGDDGKEISVNEYAAPNLGDYTQIIALGNQTFAFWENEVFTVDEISGEIKTLGTVPFTIDQTSGKIAVIGSKLFFVSTVGEVWKSK